MADTSISALRLVCLLEKVRGGLRRFWDSIKSTLASGGSGFPSYWPEWDSRDITTAADYLRELGLARDAKRLLADWSRWKRFSQDLPFMITGLLSMDASEGSTKHRDWMAEEFGVFPDNIDPKDLSAVNRHVLIVRHLIHLSGFVDELIDAVKTKFPSLTVRTVDGTESQNLGGGKGGAAAGATEATPPAANPPEPTPDGPQPPRSFSWQGKPHELPIEDPTLPWRLLVFLWGKPSVAVAEIAAVVWKNKRTRYATMKPTVTRLNNAMRVKGLPSIFWTKKRGGNCLVYHGPPLGSSVSR